jgi:hypothetical protein
MKKLTTTMVQETLNKPDGRLTVGLDLGDRSSFYCVLDEMVDSLKHRFPFRSCPCERESLGLGRPEAESAMPSFFEPKSLRLPPRSVRSPHPGSPS